MRTIKFRVRSLGIWVYGSLEVFSDDKKQYARIKFDELCTDGDLGITIPVGHDYLVDPETVGQFTGLKDKNDKEIYENDVVKVKTLKGVVTWHPNGYFCIHTTTEDIRQKEYTPIGSLVDWIHRELYVDGLEVIGNIHDNPELLKGAEQ